MEEAKYYNQFRELEKGVDMTVKSKKLDLEEMAIQPSPKVKTMMLLHIYNTHYNQGNVYTISKDSSIKVPAWSLRIQGKILMSNKMQDSEELSTISPYLKMTHFLRKVEISFNKEQVDYPDLEWNKETAKNPDRDGIEIIREGNKELDLSISIYINYSPRQFKVKPKFFSLIGIRQCTKVQAISALWEYIKANRLQDQQNRQKINCNKELKALSGQDTLEFSALLECAKDWLEDPEPYKINYKLK